MRTVQWSSDFCQSHGQQIHLLQVDRIGGGQVGQSLVLAHSLPAVERAWQTHPSGFGHLSEWSCDQAIPNDGC